MTVIGSWNVWIIWTLCSFCRSSSVPFTPNSPARQKRPTEHTLKIQWHFNLIYGRRFLHPTPEAHLHREPLCFSNSSAPDWTPEGPDHQLMSWVTEGGKTLNCARERSAGWEKQKLQPQNWRRLNISKYKASLITLNTVKNQTLLIINLFLRGTESPPSSCVWK